MIALILRSAAATCIIPMQDWLGLDNSARINKPSKMCIRDRCTFWPQPVWCKAH